MPFLLLYAMDTAALVISSPGTSDMHTVMIVPSKVVSLNKDDSNIGTYNSDGKRGSEPMDADEDTEKPFMPAAFESKSKLVLVKRN